MSSAQKVFNIPLLRETIFKYYKNKPSQPTWMKNSNNSNNKRRKILIDYLHSANIYNHNFVIKNPTESSKLITNYTNYLFNNFTGGERVYRIIPKKLRNEKSTDNIYKLLKEVIKTSYNHRLVNNKFKLTKKGRQYLNSVTIHKNNANNNLMSDNEFGCNYNSNENNSVHRPYYVLKKGNSYSLNKFQNIL